MASTAPRDPALDHPLEGPSAFRRKRLLRALPLLVWVLIAIPALGFSGPETGAGQVLLLGLVCTGVPPFAAVTVVHNLGVVALHQGDVPTARALMAHARATGWFETFQFRRLRAGFDQGHAMASLISGDLETAQATLDAVGPVVGPGRGAVDAARLLLLLRQDRPEQALAVGHQLPEAGLSESLVSIARLATAWAAERAGEPPEVVDALVARVPTLEPGRPAWAATWWPELLEFARQRDRSDDTR